MPEAQSKYLKEILGESDGQKAFTSERQHTAQAFTLHVEWKDGRKTEGFAWAHYLGYRWTDNGETEKLVLVFGERAIEIEGHNLGLLVDDIREGKLNSIKELSSSKQMLLKANPTGEPVISAIRSFPDLDEILMDIKGEKHGNKAGHAGKLQR